MNGLARERHVIAIDNSGIGNSGGTTPDNVEDMTLDAIKIITALGVKQCDLLGFSLGGFVAQVMAAKGQIFCAKLFSLGRLRKGPRLCIYFLSWWGKHLNSTTQWKGICLFLRPNLKKADRN